MVVPVVGELGKEIEQGTFEERADKKLVTGKIWETKKGIYDVRF